MRSFKNHAKDLTEYLPMKHAISNPLFGSSPLLFLQNIRQRINLIMQPYAFSDISVLTYSSLCIQPTNI